MSALFKKPKVETPQTVDPADVENRKGAQRLRRLAEGGSGSTILTAAMKKDAASSAPRSTLTGMS